ncbi:MAG TPA: hypothetical protein EYP47_00710, partial [Methanococcaceae archaeon]|nr:hypothetical protein [Methanococcaceae archaeon]
MKNSWKFLVAILLLLGMLSVVAANPLVVTYQERYNITANVSAEGTIDYSLHSLIGYLVINNTASKDILSDVWVAIDIQNNVSEPKVVHDTTPKGVYITNSVPAYTGLPDGLTYVHVPILPNKTYVEIVIELNKSKIGIPIIVNEAHSITKVPAYKMVTWNVTFNISRNVSVLPSEDTQVYVNVTKYLSNDPNHYGSSYWTYLNISNAKASMGDIELWDSRYFNGTAKDALNWTNVVLSKLRDKEIIGSLNFAVTANNSYTGREAIEVPYGFAVIFFDFSGSVSNTTVKDVYAIGDCEVIVDKRGPELDTTTGQYILWYENTSFKNAGNEYYYNITKVNIWAVNGSDPEKLNPFDKSLWINGSNYSLSPNIIKGPGEIWSSDNYNFTFPGVPVVWANYSFKIAEESITLLQHVVNEYQDEYGSSYIVVEKIYLVGSYLIKVTKTIKTNEDGTYTIYIVVENIGSHKSP